MTRKKQVGSFAKYLNIYIERFYSATGTLRGGDILPFLIPVTACSTPYGALSTGISIHGNTLTSLNKKYV